MESAASTNGFSLGFSEPFFEALAVRYDRGLKYRARHIRLAHLFPTPPALLECLELTDLRHGKLLGKPHLRGNRLFQPLLKIARVECPHRFPAAFCVLASGPIGLTRTWPVAWRDEDKSAFGFLAPGKETEPMRAHIITLSFSLHIPTPCRAPITDLPSGIHGVATSASTQAIPTPAFCVVVSREVNPPQFMAGRVNQLTQQYRKQMASGDIPLGPILDLTGLDG